MRGAINMQTRDWNKPLCDDSFIPAETEGRRQHWWRVGKKNKMKEKQTTEWGKTKTKMHKRNLKTNQVDPERPATYVAQSRTPDSNKAFITPAKPIMARKPPPEPAMAITGTFNTQEETQRHIRCTLLYHYCLYFFLLCNLWHLHRECATPVESHPKHLGFQLFHHFCCATSRFCIYW